MGIQVVAVTVAGVTAIHIGMPGIHPGSGAGTTKMIDNLPHVSEYRYAGSGKRIQKIISGDASRIIISLYAIRRTGIPVDRLAHVSMRCLVIQII